MDKIIDELKCTFLFLFSSLNIYSYEENDYFSLISKKFQPGYRCIDVDLMTGVVQKL